MSDDENDWIAGFEGLTVDLHAFRHADHVRLGWAYLRRYGLLDGIARFTAALLRFTTHHGARDKFHATITVAYMLLIHERLGPADQGFESFAAHNADLFERDALDRLYRPETLHSAEARARFVLPDRPPASDSIPDARPESEPS